MMQRAPIISGIISFAIGAIFLLNALSGITGLAIFKDISNTKASFAGTAFVILGLLLLASSREDGK